MKKWLFVISEQPLQMVKITNVYTDDELDKKGTYKKFLLVC